MIVHTIRRDYGTTVELHSNPPSMCIKQNWGVNYGYVKMVELFQKVSKELNFPLPENFRISLHVKRLLYPTLRTKEGKCYVSDAEVFFVDLTEANIATYV